MTTNPSAAPRMRVAVFGAHSETNLGDHAIYRGVKQFFSLPGMVVDTYRCGVLRPYSDPDGASGDGGAETRGARSTLTERLSSVRLLKRSVRGIRQEWLVRRLMPQLAQADLVCVGGGELLSDRELYFPQSLVAIARAVQTLRIPLWCLGCGTCGQWTDRGQQMIVEFLESCDAIAVRDHTTAGHVAQVTGRNVPLFGDFAMPLQPLPATGPTPRPFALAINVAQVPGVPDAAQDVHETQLVEVGRRFAKAGRGPGRVVLFTTDRSQDQGALDRVRARFGDQGVAVSQPRSVAELEQLLDDSEVIMAGRLHAAVLALARGRPVVGFSPTPKISRFFASFGLEPYSVAPSDGAAQQALQLLSDAAALQRQLKSMDQSQCWKTREFMLQQVQRLSTRSRSW